MLSLAIMPALLRVFLIVLDQTAFLLIDDAKVRHFMAASKLFKDCLRAQTLFLTKVKESANGLTFINLSCF